MALFSQLLLHHVCDKHRDLNPENEKVKMSENTVDNQSSHLDGVLAHSNPSYSSSIRPYEQLPSSATSGQKVYIVRRCNFM